jgi:hypothetical protein
MSTSVAYLRKRLTDIGRLDLLAAAERGEVSFFAASEAAGLIRRKEVLGTGSGNQARRRMWALARATGQAPRLPPEPKPEIGSTPAPPRFSQETRDIIARLVEFGRADLVVLVAERRISPFQAARIADRGGGRRRPLPESPETSAAPVHASELTAPTAESPKSDEPATGTTRKREASKAPNPAPRIDVRALVG